MKKGFTLIELLSVIVVLAIIAVIAIPTLIGVVNKVKLQSLKSSAYGLIEAGTLYNAEYGNTNNARFDIMNNAVTTTELNKIKYKGHVKQGTIIVSNKGKVSVCVTDEKNSAYKNYNDTEVTLVSKKTCSVPSNTAVIYLDGEATIDSVDAKAILDKMSELETQIAAINSKLNNSSSGMRVIKSGTINATTTIQLGETIDVDKYVVLLRAGSYGANFSGYWGKTGGAYVSAKTRTSVTINSAYGGETISYEIVKIG